MTGSSAVARRLLVCALLPLAAAVAPHAYAHAGAEDERGWAWEACWAGVAVDVPASAGAPLTISPRLMDIGFQTADERYELQVPLLGFAFDLRSPSGGRGNGSASFLQAPLLFAAAATIADHAKSRAVDGIMAALLWLSGGTFRFTPGGPGNLRVFGPREGSLSIALRNEFSIHPGEPGYVRDTVGLGLGFRMNDPQFNCGLGVFASGARGFAGDRSFDPGIWVNCGVSYLPPND
jgi:hypothetical protein